MHQMDRSVFTNPSLSGRSVKPAPEDHPSGPGVKDALSSNLSHACMNYSEATALESKAISSAMLSHQKSQFRTANACKCTVWMVLLPIVTLILIALIVTLFIRNKELEERIADLEVFYEFTEDSHHPGTTTSKQPSKTFKWPTIKVNSVFFGVCLHIDTF